jgi:hypothetical protein
VEVVVGGALVDGGGVCDGVWVERNSVGDAVNAEVGVSVPGAFDGRLQADRLKTTKTMGKKRCDLIVRLLGVCPLSYAGILLMAIAQPVPWKNP